MRLVYFLLLALAAVCSGVASNTVQSRVSCHNAQSELSELCSDSAVPAIDQRMLGHGDILLPVLSYHMLPAVEVTSTQHCAVVLFRDHLQSLQELTVERKGDDKSDTFNFADLQHQEGPRFVNQGVYDVKQLPIKTSGLPVFQIAKEGHSTAEFFAKLYPYPAATDAFHGDLFSNYVLEQLQGTTFQTAGPLLTRKCLLKGTGEVFYANLVPAAAGVSLKSLITEATQSGDKEASQRLKKAIQLAAVSVGEMHGRSSRLSSSELGEMAVIYGQSVEDSIHAALDPLLPVELVALVAKEMDQLKDIAVKSLESNKKGGIPGRGVYTHYDLSSNNIFVDLANARATLMDSPLMYKSMLHTPVETQCDTKTFLANPLTKMRGVVHPSLDYYYLLSYLAVECNDLVNAEALPPIHDIVKDAYCRGYYSWNNSEGAKKALGRCLNVDYLWGRDLDMFYLQYLVSLFSPTTVADNIRTMVEGSTVDAKASKFA